MKAGFCTIAATVCLGLFIMLLSRQLRLNYERNHSARQIILEYFLLLALKAFTFAYLASILAAALFFPALLLSLWRDIQSLPGELPFITTFVPALLGSGGLMALLVAFRKRLFNNDGYLPADAASEPELCSMITHLGGQFETETMTDIRIVPGAEIRIREQVETFDQVFAGGQKIVEVGLAGMEMLSAGDLKILLAREFVHYANDNNSSLAFIRRLLTRFEIMVDNLTDSSFLLTFNPVAWLVLLSKPAVLSITENYLIMNEYKADNLVLKFSGTSRLTHALARYNVETELLKDLLNIIGQSGKTGLGYVGNFYDSMRRAQVESTGDLIVMIEHLFRDTALARGDVGKRSLRLRLRRLPEMTGIGPEINRPAIAYLSDWRKTENRMLRLMQM